MSNETRIRWNGAWVAPSDIRRWTGTVWSPVSAGYVRKGDQWVRIWPPRAPQAIDTYDSIDTALWHDASNGWYESSWGTQPTQGSHYYGGAHRGVWFYGSRPWANALAADGGRYIDKIEVFLHRVSGHLGWGSTNAVSPRMWLHGYNTQPGGKPGLFAGPQALSGIARGESKWVTLPSSWHRYFLDGRARGIAVYTSTGGPIMSFQSRSDSVTTGRLRITHS